MRKLVAAMAMLAVVFVIGCQDTKKVTELQGQVDQLKQQIAEYEGQIVVKLTAERDSLQKILNEMTAKKTGTKGGSAPTPPSGKPPKQGR